MAGPAQRDRGVTAVRASEPRTASISTGTTSESCGERSGLYGAARPLPGALRFGLWLWALGLVVEAVVLAVTGLVLLAYSGGG